MNTLKIEDLLIAYKKAKVDCFYETGNLTALDFSKYEKDLNRNLSELYRNLISENNEWFEREDFVGSHYFTLKSVKPEPDLENKDSKSFTFYSNPRRERYDKSDNSLIVEYRITGKHPVNFHILSSLWIEKVGKHFESKIGNNSYGCRINNEIKEQIETEFYSTSKYNSRYANIGHFSIILPGIKTIGLVKKELNLTYQYDQTNKKKIYA